MVAPQDEMKITIEQAKPDHIYTEVEVMGQKIIQDYDSAPPE